MKVLYLTTMYPVPEYPQQGIFCHEQVKALKALGVDITVAVPVPFYSKMRRRTWCYEGVQIHYVHFFKLPGARDFHNTGMALLRSLKRSLDLSSFDLYHADAPLPAGHAAMLASQKYGKPFVVHGHGLDVFLDGSYKGLPNCGKISEVCQQVYQNSTAVIGVSNKVLQRIQTCIDIEGKSFVAYNGVNTDRFYPTDKRETAEVKLTAIGNLIPLKGHDFTLHAVKRLVDKGYDNLHLTIAGRGREEENLKKLTEELGLLNRVTFLGYIPYEDVARLLQTTDIFVLPSWYEALGCVYLEAMSCGVPAIGCWENGIDEIIAHGKNGCLVHNQDVQELTDCLEELMDADVRHNMGKSARSCVEKNYDWSNSAKAVLEAYDFCRRGVFNGL